jgi:hypothetical protein
VHGNFVAMHKVRSKTIDFYVVYEIDEQEAQHAFSLNNYHKEGTWRSDYQHAIGAFWRCNSELRNRAWHC